MARKDNPVSNEKRQERITLVKEGGVSIKAASERLNMSYDNARAICSTFDRYNRLQKVTYKQRTVTRRVND